VISLESNRQNAFWRGPITEASQANKIIRWIAWPFIVIPCVAGLPIFLSPTVTVYGKLYNLMLVVLIVSPSLFFLVKKTRVVAVILFVYAIIAISLTTVATNQSHRYWLVFVPIIAFWVMMSYLCWRSAGAALALPKLRSSAISD
jgi:hypothetical protein